MASITLYPTIAAHDGSQNASTGAVDIASTQIPIGRYGGVDNYTCIKFPFPSSGWLSGKTVTSLMLTLRSVDSQSGGTNTRCYLEKVASPADITTTVNDISSRTRTTAFLSFPSSSWDAWIAGQDYSYYGNALSPATPVSYFTLLLDEVIASVGVATMSSLCFIWVTTSGSFYRLPHAFGGSAAPALTITYTESPTIDFVSNLKQTFDFETDL